MSQAASRLGRPQVSQACRTTIGASKPTDRFHLHIASLQADCFEWLTLVERRSYYAACCRDGSRVSGRFSNDGGQRPCRALSRWICVPLFARRPTSLDRPHQCRYA